MYHNRRFAQRLVKSYYKNYPTDDDESLESNVEPSRLKSHQKVLYHFTCQKRFDHLGRITSRNYKPGSLHQCRFSGELKYYET